MSELKCEVGEFILSRVNKMVKKVDQVVVAHDAQRLVADWNLEGLHQIAKTPDVKGLGVVLNKLVTDLSDTKKAISPLELEDIDQQCQVAVNAALTRAKARPQGMGNQGCWCQVPATQHCIARFVALLHRALYALM